MPYDKRSVAALLKDGGGGDATSVAAVGLAEGGSVQSQHAAAIQFWELALELGGDEQLTDAQRSVAEAELAKHQAAVSAIGHPARGADHPRVV